MDKGRTLAQFQHKRLREFPTSGGSSAKAVSVKNKELGNLGEKLLSSRKWHGVAMVEFKKDKRDGKFKLIEINPKFWGSLALAIRSGVEFPYLSARMAKNEKVKKVANYPVGVKYQWVFPDDSLHLLTKPRIFPGFVIDLLNPNVGSDLWLSDPLPGVVQFGDFLLQLKRVSEDMKKRLPKGVND